MKKLLSASMTVLFVVFFLLAAAGPVFAEGPTYNIPTVVEWGLEKEWDTEDTHHATWLNPDRAAVVVKVEFEATAFVGPFGMTWDVGTIIEYYKDGTTATFTDAKESGVFVRQEK